MTVSTCSQSALSDAHSSISSHELIIPTEEAFSFDWLNELAGELRWNDSEVLCED